MAALEKQSSTGKTHQLAQNLDNLQLADEPLPWDNDCCQFKKPNGLQCGRRKPLDGEYCWQHKAAAEAAEAAAADEVAAPMTASTAYGLLFQGNDHWEDKTLSEFLTERYVVSYLDKHSFTQV